MGRCLLARLYYLDPLEFFRIKIAPESYPETGIPFHKRPFFFG